MIENYFGIIKPWSISKLLPSGCTVIIPSDVSTTRKPNSSMPTIVAVLLVPLVSIIVTLAELKKFIRHEFLQIICKSAILPMQPMLVI